MNAVNLSESSAFSEGSTLWIIKNDPSLIWWKKLDLNSRYLLSQNLLREKKQMPRELETIITEASITPPQSDMNDNYILIGSEDHFLNKWILLWNDLPQTEILKLIERVAFGLNVSSIRFFSDSQLVTHLEARPMASSVSISYIENT